MPFITTDKGEVYNHRLPQSGQSGQVARDLSFTRKKARVVISVIALVLLLSDLAAAVASQATGILARDWAIIVCFGAICVATLIVLDRREKSVQHTERKLFKSAYRLFYVIPEDYSYQVVFSPALRAAMKNQALEHAVDRLFNNIDSMTPDTYAASVSLVPRDIQTRYDFKVQFIEQVEELYARYGIRAKRHFTKLRQTATQMMHAEREEASYQHEADGVILHELAQVQ